MKPNPQIMARICQLVTPHLRIDLRGNIIPDAELADLRVDALDRVTFACELDEEWSIEISDTELEGWQTLADLAATVDFHLTRTAPAKAYAA